MKNNIHTSPYGVSIDVEKERQEAKEERHRKFMEYHPKYSRAFKMWQKEQKKKEKKLEKRQAILWLQERKKIELRNLAEARRARRADEFAELRKKGMTLEEIGNSLPGKRRVTRERVRQILKKYHPHLQVKLVSRTRKAINVIVKKCPACGKTFQTWHSVPNKIHCNISCYRAFYKKKNEEQYGKGLTGKEYLKAYRRKQAKQFYHKHKHDPVWLAKHYANTKKYAEKRKLKNK